MNAKRLLEHYEQIADAPGAISRLRSFILDLAVRGKLVPQDPGEESASSLMTRIAAERERLEGLGEAKRGKPLTPVGEEAEFEIPVTWVWTRVGSVAAYIQRGKSPKYATSGGSLVVSQRCVQWGGLDLAVAKRVTFESLASYEAIRFLRDGDLLWNSTGTGTIGRVIRVESPPDRLVCDSHVTVVRCVVVDPEYIRTWLRSDHVFGRIEDRAAGSTNQVELTAQMATNQVVPLPPLGEQRRIVARVYELMALCDRLEAAQSAREATRDRLASASLARVNGPGAEVFCDNARFVLEVLPALTARPDQIKTIRDAIKSLAIHGKLVAQDPHDEPASELLERIAREKARMVKVGNGRVRNISSRARDGQIEFDCPSGWSLTELGAIAVKITDGAHRTPTYVDRGVPFVSVKDFSGGKLDLSSTRFIPENEHRILYQRCDPRRGDILIGRIGTLGKAVLVDTDIEFSLFVSVGLIRFDHRNLDPKFFRLLLNSPFVEAEFDRIKVGGGTHTNKLNLSDLHTVTLPIPPLAEQHRIVAKVNELMSFCDRLEVSLLAGVGARLRLLDALIADAFAPVSAGQMSAP
ncbi:MAG: restriction endonuclease subunit S [Myxococcota bacterium]